MTQLVNYILGVTTEVFQTLLKIAANAINHFHRLDALNYIVNQQLCCRYETARCSLFLPASNDSSIVIYIHCIKAG